MPLWIKDEYGNPIGVLPELSEWIRDYQYVRWFAPKYASGKPDPGRAVAIRG